MIPKIIFTYWEGDQLSIMHYYTIFSLLKYNPEINITIYTSKIKGAKLVQWYSGEHSINIENKVTLESLKNIDTNRVCLVEIDFKEAYNIENDISIIYKADFTRIAKLLEHGGMWFDMDILFIKRIPEVFFNSNVEFYYYTYSNTIPTGLLLSSAKNAFIQKVYDKALGILVNMKKDHMSNYQIVGPNLWNECFNEFKHLCISHCLERSEVYPYDCDEIGEMYSKEKCLNIKKIEEKTYGIHWYNGDSGMKKFINELNISQVNPNNTILEKMLVHVIRSHP
jgi:mannosyltransferase OCH1-like enzyme